MSQDSRRTPHELTPAELPQVREGDGREATTYDGDGAAGDGASGDGANGDGGNLDGANGDAPAASAARRGNPPRTPEEHAQFDLLLQYLKSTRNLDLTGYKPAGLMRRFDKRMAAVNVDDYVAFIDYLEVHPEEFKELFNEILINVTAFFRDADAWTALRSDVIPRILAEKGADEPVRIWSAGCASGEEAFTLAIVFAEAMGIEAFKARVKIYATDADERALAFARQGTYEERQVEGVPADLRDKYFEHTRDGRYSFRSDLRRALIFGRHDLMQDAPISRVDLLVCRNVLMYFNTEMQDRILRRFAFVLNESGALFLGRAETLLSRGSLFNAVDLKRRFFARVNNYVRRDRLFAATGGDGSHKRPGDENLPWRLRDSAFDSSPFAQVVVNVNGIVVSANERARSLFSLAPTDIGRPLQDLEMSYRPLELRSRIDEVHRTRRTVTVAGVTLMAPIVGAGTCDVQFVALADDAGNLLGVTINFIDTTSYWRLQRELEHANQELETAYEELQSTNEELETTNEELQSTVEELETTNEELQSTNEELETMNEELQSTNEELQSINDAMRVRGEELEQANGFLDAVLTSFRGGIVVLDREMRVTAWNVTSADQWGLRREEVIGRNFFTLDIGLPVHELHHPIRTTLAGESNEESIRLNATNRRGKPMACTVTCLPLRLDSRAVGGVMLIVDQYDDANSRIQS